MFEPWILLTITAALLQSVRTAAQKQLTAQLSIPAGTYVRAFLGLPLMLAYLGAVSLATAAPWPPLNDRFFLFALATAVTQLAATAATLALFQLRNFAVANQLGKSDMVFTAILGAMFFGQVLGLASWIALLLTGAGVVTIMAARAPAGGGDGLTAASWWRSPSVRLGLFVGLMFGICNLTLREATLSLNTPSAYLAGATTVAVVTALQVVIMAGWLAVREPDVYRAIFAQLPLAGFVGMTSAAGSIAWFTAFALETAAHVRIVGQIEVVFTLLISAYYFRERLSGLEALGIALTVAGIVLVQVAG